jgi:hypothetical protein
VANALESPVDFNLLPPNEPNLHTSHLFPLQLRVAQVTNGAASKLGKIGHVRKNVARVLTVLNQKSMSDFQKQATNLKRVPKQLRAKLTRAKRRALTPAQVRLQHMRWMHA